MRARYVRGSDATGPDSGTTLRPEARRSLASGYLPTRCVESNPASHVRIEDKSNGSMSSLSSRYRHVGKDPLAARSRSGRVVPTTDVPHAPAPLRVPAQSRSCRHRSSPPTRFYQRESSCCLSSFFALSQPTRGFPGQTPPATLGPVLRIQACAPVQATLQLALVPGCLTNK